MNPRLSRLMPYPFEKLAALKAGITPPGELDSISLSIGEPRHPAPDFIFEAFAAHRDRLGNYPKALGLPEFREAAANWLQQRYTLPEGMVDPETQVLPVNGTREALFAFVQAAVDPAGAPLVLMPNPCYQIYEGGAILAGAEPGYLDTTADNGFLPDLDRVSDAQWDRCQVLFLCSPGNPTGAVMDLAFLEHAIELADRHDFLIASDECYADIYLDDEAPPPGLLEACARLGRTGAERCIVFHSLSKRSNVPGLRSGFVAGDATSDVRLSLVPDLPRLRRAGSRPACEHSRLERRGTCTSEPGPVPAEIRGGDADPGVRARRAKRHRRPSMSGRACPGATSPEATRSLPGTCSLQRT